MRVALLAQARLALSTEWMWVSVEVEKAGNGAAGLLPEV